MSWDRLFPIIDKLAERWISPEGREKIIKQSITKRNRLAIENAERVFLALDMDWFENRLALNEEDEKEFKRLKRLFERNKRLFFKHNN